jgi:dihydrofolate reductase
LTLVVSRDAAVGSAAASSAAVSSAHDNEVVGVAAIAYLEDHDSPQRGSFKCVDEGDLVTRRVVLYELMSLDGFADDPGEGDWFGDADERLIGFLGEVIARQDTVLLGRRTFEKWAPYWPTSTMQPFSDFINGTPKIVFSSTAPTSHWAETMHVAEPPAPFVAGLKQRGGADIGIHGSLSVARTLLAEHLVDELRLVVAPNLAGGGTRLFDGDGDLQRFELLSADRSGGCLLLHYQRRERT